MVLKVATDTPKGNIIIEELEKFLRSELLRTWTEQGHYMNGKIVKEADFVVKRTLEGIDLSIFMFAYGAIMETGTQSSKIPFSKPTGRGGTSKYIQALVKYAQKRMSLPDQQAKQVAFAIAMKQKQEGMPTSDSFRYSSTGKRTRWIQETMLRTRGKIQERLFNYMDVVLSTTFENMILKYTSTQ